jgi:general secretion pathway protein J
MRCTTVITFSRQNRNRASDRGSTGLNGSGFTLVELMVAMLLFSIVITTIFSSYSAVFTSAETVEKAADRYEMAGICLQRMWLDLQSIQLSLPPQYKKPEFNDPPDPYRVVGTASDADNSEFPRLEFASLAHVPGKGTDYGGIARIVYYVRRGEKEGTYSIRRSDVLSPSEPFEASASDPVLCEEVKSLKITYVDDEGTAHESWNSESEEFNYASPTAIEILLGVAHNQDAVFFSTAVKLPVRREALE